LKGLLIGAAFGAILPGGPFTAYPVASALLTVGADSARPSHGGELDPDRYGARSPGNCRSWATISGVAHRDLVPLRPCRRARTLRLCRIYPKARVSALIIDIILWGSVAALGFMAWQRGRTVRCRRRGKARWTHQHRARIALGVNRLRLHRRDHPASVITGWLGPDSGWSGVLAAVIGRCSDAGRTGGRVFHRRRRPENGGGAPQVIAMWSLGAVCLPALIRGKSRSCRRVLWFRAAVSVRPHSCGGDRHGHRAAR